jgi:hypothetical protein
MVHLSPAELSSPSGKETLKQAKNRNEYTSAGLNLNNEVFGFYYGAPQYFTQREYYKPTFTFGLKWDLRREK